jgi:hypothetical protein
MCGVGTVGDVRWPPGSLRSWIGNSIEICRPSLWSAAIADQNRIRRTVQDANGDVLR